MLELLGLVYLWNYVFGRNEKIDINSLSEEAKNDLVGPNGYYELYRGPTGPVYIKNHFRTWDPEKEPWGPRL